MYHIQIIHPYRYSLNIECIKVKSKKLRYDKITQLNLNAGLYQCIQNIHPEYSEIKIKIEIKKIRIKQTELKQNRNH